MVCIRHATHIGTCVIQGCSIDSFYFNWDICIPMIISLNLHNIGRLLQRRCFILQSLKLDRSHSSSKSSSEELSCKIFPPTSWFKVASLLPAETVISSLWTSVLATTWVVFYINFTVLVGLLVMGLAANCTVSLSMVWVFVGNFLGVTVGCGTTFCFGYVLLIYVVSLDYSHQLHLLTLLYQTPFVEFLPTSRNSKFSVHSQWGNACLMVLALIAGLNSFCVYL